MKPQSYDPYWYGYGYGYNYSGPPRPPQPPRPAYIFSVSPPPSVPYGSYLTLGWRTWRTGRVHWCGA